MIKRIRNKGLERFFRDGDTRGIDAQHAAWLRILLTALNTATRPEHLNRLPGDTAASTARRPQGTMGGFGIRQLAAGVRIRG
jgi:plasmid maintenance system killer protein